MLHWERAKDYPTLFRRLTGLSVEAFEQLMEVLTKAYPDFERTPLQRRGKRAIGESSNSPEERVIMTFFSFAIIPPFLCSAFSLVFTRATLIGMRR